MLQGDKKKRVLLCQVLLVGASLCASNGVLAESHAESRNVERVFQESQQFARSKKVAVIVGVGKYTKQSHLKPLKFAATDARMIEKVLKNRHGYSTRVLTDAEGNKDHILDAIRQAGELLPPDGQGTLVFFFSGHGFARGGKNFLATSNLTPGRLQQSALTITEVEAAIKETKARRAIILVDACRDDPWIDGAKSYAPSKFIVQRSAGVQHLFGAKFGEQSWESAKLSNGVFSHFLYRGLNGEAVERDGIISFDSLKRYVQDKVGTWSYENLSTVQLPYHAGEAYGVFVLGQVGKHVRPSPVSPPIQSRPATPVEASPKTARPQPVKKPVPKPARKQWFEPDLANIPAGRFTMGCDPARDNVAGGCSDDEKPAHSVNIAAFKMAKTEVTFEQWDACRAAGVCIKADDEGWGRGKRPVINVSWNDIQTYLKWLSQQTGKRYQLPSEAQWEYAARANRNTAFPWGNTITCKNANFGYFSDECKTDRTKPVASYQANAFGLYDTSGNVEEWTQDCWQATYQGASANGAVKEGCGSGQRVIRGGSWIDSGRNVRSAFRDHNSPDLRDGIIGLRLSLVN